MKKTILAGVLALAAATSSAADLVTNGSFENEVQGAGSWSVWSALSGWTVSSGGVEVRNNVAGTAYAGSNFIELDAYANSWIEQTLNTVAGQAYQLSFFYTPREGVSAASNPVDVLIDGNQAGSFTGYLASGVAWTKYTVDFVGAASGLNTIRFAASGSSDGIGGSLDAVSVTAVPEPSSLAMLLAGLGMMGFIARRRTRA